MTPRPTTLLTRLAAVLLLAGCASTDTVETDVPQAEGRPHVVMVSFDGMHPDMVARVSTPNFDRLASSGVRAEALIPGYPTKTFPNHYSIATGLYPAHHGLVDNSFYDPTFDATYSLGNSEAVQDGRWYGGEPIWVTAETQGMTAASFFWVGTEAAIDGVRPTYSKEYDGSVPYEARVDTVLSWLALPPAERPQLVMLYFDEPDHIAHELGPNAPAVDSTVAELDRLLGTLLDGLEALPIADDLHLFVTSDHGMLEAPADQVIHVDDAVDLDGIRMVSNTTQMLLYFDDDQRDRINVIRDAVNDRLPHATAYLPDETPEHWHYRGTDRIGDLIIAADPGWVLRMRDWRPWSGGGTHGWDPADPRTHGIFFARGPRLRAGAGVAAFENVHIYPLVAHLLGLEPAAGIDGRLEVLRETLREPARR